ncbi:MAG: histidine phosphatase family protein [Chloroflexi bacterium]|nr:histidine phosphatase family protein [Chloroflexota bacterium]
MATSLYLVRHGETDANRDGLALGRADVPLNECGLGQAERLREALKNEPFAAIYSSPLSRTLKTAEVITVTRGLDVTVEKSLVEMDVGDLDGLTFAEVRERYPSLLERWTSPDGPNERLPGGERLLDVHARATEFLNRIRELHPTDSVCAVTHNFVILTILADVLVGGIGSFRRLRHSVAAISVLEVEGSRWRVVRMNDTSHLDDGR